MKDKDIKTWVKALRSGKYKQGHGRLCETINGEDRHCCLGVMIDELVETDWNGVCAADGRVHWVVEGNGAFPPNKMANFVGLKMSDAEVLAEMNDDGDSFEEIADWIEVNLTPS